jgi:transcriptional regulator with XRE-family HTH domain
MDPTKLLNARESLNLTQAQVAERAGMSQQAYANIEIGKRSDPKLSTAERIADALGTTVDALRVDRGKRKKK